MRQPPYPIEVPGTAIAVGAVAVPGTVTSVVAGTGILVTGAPMAPVVSATGVQSVTAGTNVTLTGTAKNPIVNATGGGSGTSNVVTFQPGGTPSGTTFDTFAALCAYIAGIGAAVERWTIQIDGSLTSGSAEIAAGTYAVPACFELVSVANTANPGAYTTLSFDSDVLFSPAPAEISFINLPFVQLQNTTAPLVSTSTTLEVFIDDCDLSIAGGGTFPFFGAVSGGTVNISLRNYGEIDSYVLSVDATSSGIVGALDETSITAGAITIDSGGSVNIYLGGAAITIDESYWTAAGVTVNIPTGLVASGTFATPNGTVTASPGALFATSGGGVGTTFWVKETGTSTNTGWSPFGATGGFTPAYGSVQNTSTTSILGGANANFNITAGPSAGVAQGAGGLTVAAAGDYQYGFQVRGTPTHTLTPPAPLIYALSINGSVAPATQFASDTQTSSLPAAGTEVVTGQGFITLGAGAVVALSNQTESGVTPQGDTGLASAPLGGTASVNVQLSLVRVG